MTVDERARAGLFLAMQYPVEVPGVSVSNFLRTAEDRDRRRGAEAAHLGQGGQGRRWTRLDMDPAFAERNVNEGFSGGEKKRHEILQLELLKPKIAILDETDSGLDIDALRVVSEGVNRVRETGETGVLLITHYTRILRYIKPDFVHVFVDGRIVEEGGPELADKLEAEGYERYVEGGGCDHDPDGIGSSAGPARRRADPQGLPDPGPHGRTTAGRWSTSTAPPPRRSRGRCSTRWPSTTSGTTPTSHRGVHALGRGGHGAVRGRARQGRRVHRRAEPRRGGLHQERHRGAQPGRQHARAGPTSPTGIGPGDEIVITEMEHHSNIVPWQLLCERTGATLRWFGLTDDGRLDLSELDELINERTKVVSLVHVSNILGTVNPVARDRPPGARGRRAGRARRLAGGAAPAGRRGRRSAPTSSPSPGTRCVGPTGIGVLWGRRELLDALPPFLGGGEMIETVTMDAARRTPPPPHKFEAGTPPIAQAVGLGAAVDYLTAIGMDDDRTRTSRRSPAYALERLARGPRPADHRPDDGRRTAAARSRFDARRHPPARRRPGARRAGHRGPGRAPLRPAGLPRGSACRRSTRASFYLYTTPAEIDALVDGLEHVQNVLRVA